MADLIRIQVRGSDSVDDWKDVGEYTGAPRIPVRVVDGVGTEIDPATEAKQDDIITAVRPLAGAGVNGTVALASANTWYAVPSTVPTSDYILVATIENGLGTVRFGFTNSSTPSTTNGNVAPGELTVKLAANQSLYYGSSTAGDDINWVTKIL